MELVHHVEDRADLVDVALLVALRNHEVMTLEDPLAKRFLHNHPEGVGCRPVYHWAQTHDEQKSVVNDIFRDQPSIAISWLKNLLQIRLRELCDVVSSHICDRAPGPGFCRAR